MRRMRLGRTNLNVSPVVYGGIIHMGETQQTANDEVREAVEAGINYFDVAPTYGDAEALLGPALQPFRQEVYLACKTAEREARAAKEQLLNSLKALRTSYFDVYQLHALSTQEDLEKAFGPGGAMETILWARKEGLIRNVGFSAHNEDVALQACSLYDFDTILYPMNWAMGLTVGWGDRIAENAKQADRGLICMKTLVHRLWREGEERVYPKSWCKPLFGDERLMVCAMKYGFYKGGATLVPPGNIEHFRFMLEHVDECLDNPLTPQELELLRTEAEKVRGELIFNV